MRNAGLRAFVAIAAGIALQAVLHLPWWFLLGYALLALALFPLTRGYSLLLALLASSALSTAIALRPAAPVPFLRKARYEAVVLSEPIPRAGSQTYAVELTRVRLAAGYLPVGLKARFGTGRTLSYGTTISFVGAMLPFAYPRNPGIVDLNDYYRRQGFSGRVRSQSSIIRKPGAAGNPVLRLAVMPLRRFFIRTIGRWFGGENRALLAGLLLGEKADMPSETQDAFARAGVTHVLAVSGLNISILVGVCILLLSVLRIRGGFGLTLLVIVTFFYVGITGFSASAVRAGLMAIAASIGLFIQRRYDPLNGIFIAGVVILLVDPIALLDVGFQLSFTATLAIVLFHKPILALFGRLKDMRRLNNWVLSPLALTAAGTLGTLPLVMYYFQRISLVALLANLLVVPLVAIATPLGMLLMLVARTGNLVTGLIAQPLDVLLSATIWLTERLGSFPWSAPVLGRPPLPAILWFYVLLVLLVFALTRKWARKALLFSTVAGAAIWLWSGVLQPRQLQVTFLDTVKGDATLIEFPNGRNLLYDAGSADDFWFEPLLRSKGIQRIDALVISHPHAHVVTGIENILDRVQVANAVVPVDSSDEPGYDSLLARLRHSGTRIIRASRGQQLAGFGADLTVLHPSPLHRQMYQDRLLAANDASLVLRLDCTGRTMLLPGDLDNPALVADQLEPADLLKASHQGSIRANNELLLATVRPSFLIISGRPRPRPELVNRCARLGISALNTRRDGAVVAGIRDTSWRITQ